MYSPSLIQLKRIHSMAVKQYYFKNVNFHKFCIVDSRHLEFECLDLSESKKITLEMDSPWQNQLKRTHSMSIQPYIDIFNYRQISASPILKIALQRHFPPIFERDIGAHFIQYYLKGHCQSHIYFGQTYYLVSFNNAHQQINLI